MKTNNGPICWLYFECLRGAKLEEQIEKRVSKTVQNRRAISKQIFDGFWSILEALWAPRSTQNRRKRGSKTRPIFTGSCKVVQHRSGLGHCRPNLPWAPYNTRPIDPKNNRDSEDEGKIGKNPKNQEDERIMSRMTERAPSARKQLQDKRSTKL